MKIIDSVANAESMAGEIIFKVDYNWNGRVILEFVSGKRVQLSAHNGDACFCEDYCHCDPTPTLEIEILRP